MKIARLPSGDPEIFYSLQGEGISAGTPAVFIRASLCNLHCVWCDTDYTWNWEGTPWVHEKNAIPGYAKFKKEEQIIELTPADVAAAASAFACRSLVVTGGEPLLQEEDFADVLGILRERDGAWRVEVETNGTIAPGEEFDALVDQYNVSPKLANSGNKEDLRIQAKALAFFSESPKAWFKFVVTGPHDLGEIEGLRNLLALDPERILLMPEARSREDLQEQDWLTAHCLRHGFRFSDRLHIRLWDGDRGT